MSSKPGTGVEVAWVVMVRRYGGIHFEQGDLNGRTLDTQIGSLAWSKAQTYFNGTAG